MTLKYRLFRIPGNKQEFQEEITREGIVDISLDEFYDNYGAGQSVFYQCFPILQTGGKKLSLKKGAEKHLIIPSTNKGDLERLTVQEQVFARILDLASHYQDKGFQVTIAGKSVEEAKTESDQYLLKRRDHLKQRAIAHKKKKSSVEMNSVAMRRILLGF